MSYCFTPHGAQLNRLAHTLTRLMHLVLGCAVAVTLYENVAMIRSFGQV